MAPVDPHSRALGLAVRERRVELGLSRAVAAREWGVREPWLSRLERGEANPQITRLVALAAAMHLSLAELLRRAEAVADRRD